MLLHFNYWRTANYKIKRGQDNQPISQDFLDIGVMLDKIPNLESVNVYLPVEVQQDAISDLSGLFIHKSIATGVFNERLAPEQDHGSRNITLKDQEGKKYCVVYNFTSLKSAPTQPDVSELNRVEKCDGTILTITSHALQKAQKSLDEKGQSYFRLRIDLPSGSDAFVKTIKPIDRFFLSGFEAVEYIDFRLNEARNLPNLIEEQMNNEQELGRIGIYRVDFLLVAGMDADLILGHKNFNKSRLLETELWSSYVGNGTDAILKDDLVIYHWKEVGKALGKVEENDRSKGGDVDKRAEKFQYIADFNAFAKLRIRRSTWRLVVSYLAVSIVMGLMVAAVSGFTSYIWDRKTNRSETVAKVTGIEIQSEDRGQVLSSEPDNTIGEGVK